MQLMPDTYAEMRAQYRLGSNPYDPHDNVFAGAAYLRWLSGKYGYPAMFAAYNDGPGNIDVRQDGSLPQETRNYVSHVETALGGSAAHGRLAKFTRPDGNPVFIADNEIAAVRAALPGEYAPTVQTVITVGRMKQGVRESVASVQATLQGDRTTAFSEHKRRVIAVFDTPHVGTSGSRT
jgi:hypothetical protein